MYKFTGVEYYCGQILHLAVQFSQGEKAAEASWEVHPDGRVHLGSRVKKQVRMSINMSTTHTCSWYYRRLGRFAILRWSGMERELAGDVVQVDYVEMHDCSQLLQ